MIPVWRCEVTRNWKKPLKLSGVYDDHRCRDQKQKTQGAYNERCRCTLTGATKTEMTTILYIRFPRTETKAFRTVQEMKNSELDLWNITSTNELSAKQIPVHNHDDCFLFN